MSPKAPEAAAARNDTIEIAYMDGGREVVRAPNPRSRQQIINNDLAFALTNESEDAAPAIDRARDPRRNPRPGDVLAAGADVREVFTRIGNRVEYGFPRKSATRWLDLMGWHAWARHADVWKVA